MIIIKKLLTKSLLAIILGLLTLIFHNYQSELYLKYYQNNNLNFSKYLNIYKKLFGKPVFIKEEGLTSQVINTNSYQRSPYLDGLSLNYEKASVINAFNSGIVVFIGIKDDYGNTVIIQGIDGVDLWYGNITDLSINLYDYVEKNKIIGKPINDTLYLKAENNGTIIDLNKYLNEV